MWDSGEGQTPPCRKTKSRITLLRVIPAVTCQVLKHFCKQLQEQRLKCVRLLSTSYTDCRKSSNILSGISSDILVFLSESKAFDCNILEK